MEMENDLTVEILEERKHIFFLVTIIVYAVVFSISILLWLVSPWITWLGVILLGLYTILSLKTVEGNEQAALLIFGALMGEYQDGLKFVPFGIGKLIIVTTEYIQIQYGSPLEDDKGVKIEEYSLQEQKLTQTKDSRHGFYLRYPRPFRVSFIGKEYTTTEVKKDTEGKVIYERGKPIVTGRKTIPSKHPLEQPMTTDPQALLLYRIIHPALFYKRVGTTELANSNLAGQVASAIQSVAGKITVREAQQDLKTFSQITRQWLEWLVGEEDYEPPEHVPRNKDGKVKKNPSWGIDINNVSVQTLGLPQRLNEALRDNASAAASAISIKTRAEADRVRLQEEGEGIAHARKVLLLAEAEGFEAKALAASKPGGQEVLAAETVREALHGANYSIIPSGGLTETVTALQETLKRSSAASDQSTKNKQEKK